MQLAVDADDRRDADRQVQVGAALLHDQPQQVVDVRLFQSGVARCAGLRRRGCRCRLQPADWPAACVRLLQDARLLRR